MAPVPGAAHVPDDRSDTRRPPDAAIGPARPPATGPRKWILALAAHPQFTAIGAVVVAFTIVALVVSFRHSPAASASKCQQDGCPHVVSVMPVTVLPATITSSPSAHPTASPRARHSAAPAVASSVPVATHSPAPPAAPPELTPGATISIRATTACCTTFYIRHDDFDDRVVITQVTPDSSATDKADSTWIVRAGLADSSCVSFESANDPGQYLRHYDFELYLEPDGGGKQFALDATFCLRSGNSGTGSSFESVNYPAMFIRHYNYVVYLAGDGGRNPWDTPVLWSHDSTWAVSRPWSAALSSASASQSSQSPWGAWWSGSYPAPGQNSHSPAPGRAALRVQAAGEGIRVREEEPRIQRHLRNNAPVARRRPGVLPGQKRRDPALAVASREVRQRRAR